MEIQIISIMSHCPKWVTIASENYCKRLPKDYSVRLQIQKTQSRNKNAVISQVIFKEGQRMLKAIPKGNVIIALDEEGEQWQTKQLSQQLKTWHDSQQNISLLIGGPDGLAAECRQRAQYIWSLSQLTLPHALVQVIVLEQLYRAVSIIQGHPYHRS